MEAPIPSPRPDDDEDVHWALSTAGALWARGERAEALKWLRRAAEQASDANADDRALELFKAAAEVAPLVSTPSMPPPAPAKTSTPPPPAAHDGPSASEARPNPVPPPRAAEAPVQASSKAPPPLPSQGPRPSAPPPPPRRPEGTSASRPPPRPASIAPGASPPPLPSVPPVYDGGSAPKPPGGTASSSAPASRASTPPPPPRPSLSSIPPTHAPRPAAPVTNPPLRAAADRTPIPGRSAPAGHDASPARATGAASTPPVVAPARTVAITAKPGPASPSSTPKRRRSFTGEPRAAAEKSRTIEAVQPGHEEGTTKPAHDDGKRAHRTDAQRPRRRTLDEADAASSPAADPAPKPRASFDESDEETRVQQTVPDGGADDVIEQAFERLRTGAGGVVEASEEPDAVTIVPRVSTAGATEDRARSAVTPASHPDEGAGPEPVAPVAPAASDSAARPAAPAGQNGAAHVTAMEVSAAPVAPATNEAVARLQEHVPDERMDDDPTSGPVSQKTKVWTQLPDMSQDEPETPRPTATPTKEAAAHLAPSPQPPKRLDTLPALRVAVLATSVPGDVRLLALATHDEAPPGAALAVLVPLSAADGEAVARLFKGLE